TTLAPSRAKSRACSRPIPRPAPVMTATRPSRIPMCRAPSVVDEMLARAGGGAAQPVSGTCDVRPQRCQASVMSGVCDDGEPVGDDDGVLARTVAVAPGNGGLVGVSLLARLRQARFGRAPVAGADLLPRQHGTREADGQAAQPGGVGTGEFGQRRPRG